MAPDILRNRFRHKSLGTSAVPQSVPDVRRRNIQGLDRQQKYAEPGEERFFDILPSLDGVNPFGQPAAQHAWRGLKVETGPPRHDEQTSLEHSIDLVPRPDFEEGVDADDEKDAALWDRWLGFCPGSGSNTISPWLPPRSGRLQTRRAPGRRAPPCESGRRRLQRPAYPCEEGCKRGRKGLCPDGRPPGLGRRHAGGRDGWD